MNALDLSFLNNVSSSFIHQFFFITFTVLIASILGPIIVKSIDHRRNRERLILENEIEINREIIRQKSMLIENLSHAVWDYQNHLLAVLYFEEVGNDEDYRNALRIHNQDVTRQLVSIRTEISKLAILGTEELYREAKRWYYEDILTADRKLRDLILSKSGPKERDLLNRELSTVFAEKSDQQIFRISKEMGITAHLGDIETTELWRLFQEGRHKKSHPVS